MAGKGTLSDADFFVWVYLAEMTRNKTGGGANTATTFTLQ